MKAQDIALAEERMSDRLWRFNNLYYIIDKQGQKTRFELNWPQKQLYSNMWYCNLILKARQMGISTFVCLLFLDSCLFKSNVSAGVIAHTREDAEHMFKRIKFAYDCLPEHVKALRVATVDSARELVFNNNSSLRVGTSMRGSTLQLLHISEFGKIASHYPEKAREIVTGSLNTLGNKQYIFIESTAEGKEGYFYDLCQQSKAMHEAKKQLTTLDYRFHFFPWHKCPDYVLPANESLPKEIEEYFSTLEDKKIVLTPEQKSWYYSKLLTQKDDMKREYPSTPEEAFESSIDGSFYSKWLREARMEARMGDGVNVPWDREARVNVAFDPGYLDSCAVVWWQNIGQEIHVIDYYENSGEAFSHYFEIIKKKPYIYDQIYGPSDIETHNFASGTTVKAVAQKLGLGIVTMPTVRISLDEGINAVRTLFPRIWIDAKNCSRLIKCLENYRKEWDPNYQIYKNKPIHDAYSHGADAFRYACLAINRYIDVSKEDITDSDADRMYNENNPRFD